MALDIQLGQYVAGTSPIHQLDTRVKIITTIIWMIICMFVQTPIALVSCIFLTLIPALLSRIGLGRIFYSIRHLMLFLAVTAIINIIFNQQGSVVAQFGLLRLTQEGLSYAAIYTLRFLCLMLASTLLMMTSTVIQITNAVEKILLPLVRIGVPAHDISLIISIALRYLPALSQEARNILAAQKARGADLEEKQGLTYLFSLIPLIVPLFASSLRHASRLSYALEARAYGCGITRTHYRKEHTSWRLEGVFSLILILASALVIGLIVCGL